MCGSRLFHLERKFGEICQNIKNNKMLTPLAQCFSFITPSEQRLFNFYSYKFALRLCGPWRIIVTSQIFIWPKIHVGIPCTFHLSTKISIHRKTHNGILILIVQYFSFMDYLMWWRHKRKSLWGWKRTANNTVSGL